MHMNRKLIHIWYNVDKKHLLFTKRKCHSFRGYLRHPVVLPEKDRFAHAEYRAKYLYSSVFIHWALVFKKKRLPSWKTVFVKRDRWRSPYFWVWFSKKEPFFEKTKAQWWRQVLYTLFCMGKSIFFWENKRRVLLGVCVGGGAVTFSCGGQKIWWPPPNPLEKNSRPPPDIWYKCLWPPPQPSPQTPLFLSCCFKWGVINIARYHIPKLYYDILLSIAKLFSISAVERADKLNTRGPLVLYRSPECWGYVKISGYWGKEV